MSLNKLIFCALSLFVICSPLSATLGFQQEVTLATYNSEEGTKIIVNEFLRATEGDKGIEVVDVKYKQTKLADDFIAYEAIITCRVSRPDEDVLRIQAKMCKGLNNLEKECPLKKSK